MNDIKIIYFIGIGGIGMSALARYFHKHGVAVHGYDRTETELTSALAAEGMHLHYDDDPTRIPEGVDLVVYTPAVPADHRELNWFRERGYPIQKRAQVLGLISQRKRCVAVAGTHGKTTTSTMAAWLMRAAGVDATAFLGGLSANFGVNFVEGDSDWVVVEADEYDRSFLHLHPEIAIINSIDPDHLDIYGTPEAVVEAYKQFARQIKPGGTLIYKQGLALDGLAEELRQNGRNVVTFGIGEGDIMASRLHAADGRMVFDLNGPNNHWKALRLAYPGQHNVENLIAAFWAAFCAGADAQQLNEAVAGFKGVKRRFEYIVNTPTAVYVDDYAHHPAELEAAIQAARMMYPDWRITGVFQPHLFTRTRDFAEGFAAALDLLDECLLMPIYPARELPIPGITSATILNHMKNPNAKIMEKEALFEHLKAHKPQVLLTLGAGDIDRLINTLREMMNA
jgi:UDP-N-acetylmuramate--alanine ligase